MYLYKITRSIYERDESLARTAEMEKRRIHRKDTETQRVKVLMEGPREGERKD